MSDDGQRSREQWTASLAGALDGPGRLVVDEWRRFFVDQGLRSGQVCRWARRAMRAAAEETLKVKDGHAARLEARVAQLEAELARLRGRPESP